MLQAVTVNDRLQWRGCQQCPRNSNHRDWQSDTTEAALFSTIKHCLWPGEEFWRAASQSVRERKMSDKMFNVPILGGSYDVT